MPSINELIAERERERAETEKAKSSREHSVNCTKCFKRQTWNNDAVCDACREDDA